MPLNRAVRIALVGDYSPAVTAHRAIPKALALSAPHVVGVEAAGSGAAAAEDVRVEPVWLGTEQLAGRAAWELAAFDGIWCVPASPYASMEGALEAIRFARETGRPFLGTCGGFQHAVIEYARNVLGYKNAAHAEIDPNAAAPWIAPLSCSMVETDGEIALLPGKRLHFIYGVERVTETYHCSFGFSPRYAPLFAAGGMVVAAVNARGEPQAIELSSHPFFFATAFQPERSGLHGEPHPLITEFVRAAQCRT